ncbi:uncharacterized protein LOC135137221 [Zophobas morio]|uniref:uncharacterized protein LOC135137221 n=1 Tax=Zophobas morio TaxID=2755281 RepID=UPI0030828F8E
MANMHNHIYLVIFVFHCFVWRTVLSAAVAQGKNSKISSLHYEDFTDLKISTESPVVPKLDFLLCDVPFPPNFTFPLHYKSSKIRKCFKSYPYFPNQTFFNSDDTFAFPPISKFDTVKSVSSAKETQWHPNVNGGYWTYRKKPTPVKDDITRFNKNLPPLHIARWRNLGTPTFDVQKPSVIAEQPIPRSGPRLGPKAGLRHGPRSASKLRSKPKSRSGPRPPSKLGPRSGPRPVPRLGPRPDPIVGPFSKYGGIRGTAGVGVPVPHKFTHMSPFRRHGARW